MPSTLRDIYLGTDSGATTSKTGGVFANGEPVSRQLRQSSTNSQNGTAAVVAGWVEGAEGFLKDNGLTWDRVAAAGLALPGPYQSYGVLEKSSTWDTMDYIDYPVNYNDFMVLPYLSGQITYIAASP